MSVSGLEPGPTASGQDVLSTRPTGYGHIKAAAPLPLSLFAAAAPHHFLMSGQRGSKICDREQLRNISHFKVKSASIGVR